MVQEALTNTVKHADARHAEVVIRHTPGEVQVIVSDDGRTVTREGATDTGHGIDGMRERVATLGGALTAGPAERGFAVRAVIPTPPGPAA